ncbi:MAG: hypothetical protein ACOY3Y_04505 [Acidobacteriota bacterium]
MNGTILVATLGAAFLLSLALWVACYLRAILVAPAAGRRLFELMSTLHDREHPWCAVEAGEGAPPQPTLDVLARERGFRLLGSMESPSLASLNKEHGMPLAVAASADGAIVARVKTGVPARIYVLSELSDGRMICTTDDALAALLDPVTGDGLEIAASPADSVALADRHREALDALTRQTGLSARVVATLADAIEQEMRAQRRASAFRRLRGYLTEAEIARFAGATRGFVPRSALRRFQREFASGVARHRQAAISPLPRAR